MTRARELLPEEGQGVLDFDVTPSLPVVHVLPPVAEPGVLFEVEDDLLPAPTSANAPQVLGTDSRLLFEALDGVWRDLGFQVVDDDVFRDLVIARVVEPTSLLDAGRVLTELGRKPASYSTMRRTLSRAGQRGYRDVIAGACFDHVMTHGDISLVLYDVTNPIFRGRKRRRVA